jgi:hypothetical protein
MTLSAALSVAVWADMLPESAESAETFELIKSLTLGAVLLDAPEPPALWNTGGHHWPYRGAKDAAKTKSITAAV